MGGIWIETVLIISSPDELMYISLYASLSELPNIREVPWYDVM
jgi:hypothetical protein